MTRVVLALLALSCLAGCLPFVQGVPERLSPRYLGSEASRVDWACSQPHESIWISGPETLGLRITPMYRPLQGLTVLRIRLVHTGTRQAVGIPAQRLLLERVPGGATRTLFLPGGTARALTMTDPNRDPVHELDLELRIEETPAEGMRLQLPVVRAGDLLWQPRQLELRRISPVARLMPFNC
ncbi:MAG TPA: hypothetical protein PKH69_06425 [Thiobacillaceae bacterium]|nr:hypothetical protein [Thiobacillaceae bacterium]HNU63874.1 hypothetical protein [Thiobacillaceae bacterium]